MTGYDKKSVTLSHDSPTPIVIRLEADVSGTGTWVTCREFTVEPEHKTEWTFPESYGAYWVRAVANTETRATVQFVYE